MSNPFDVANYKSQIDWTKGNHAYKISLQQTAVVNRQRAAGIEPSTPYSDTGLIADPERFALDMPKLAKYDRNAVRRQKTKEKKMLNCKHEWQPVIGQPLYQCARCGMYMRVEK